jgi:hypothetical protein
VCHDKVLFIPCTFRGERPREYLSHKYDCAVKEFVEGRIIKKNEGLL